MTWTAFLLAVACRSPIAPGTDYGWSGGTPDTMADTDPTLEPSPTTTTSTQPIDECPEAAPVSFEVLTVADANVFFGVDDSISEDEVERIRDVSGDGHADVAISSLDPVTGERHIYLLPGEGPYGVDTESLSSIHLPVPPVGLSIEFMIDAEGDLTGDGRNDLILTTPNSAPGPGYDGAALIYSLQPLEKISSEDYGASVVSGYPNPAFFAAGDATGDGAVDLAISEIHYGEHGRLQIVAGPITGPMSAEDAAATLLWSPLDYGWVSSLTAVDLSGDGQGDVAIGDNLQVRIVRGPLTGVLALETDTDALLTVDEFNCMDGWVVELAPFGDADGDGLDDLLVSGCGIVPGSLPDGEYDMPDVALTRFVDDEVRAAYDFQPAGDFNGDGFLDLLMTVDADEATYGSDDQAALLFGPFAATTCTLTDADLFIGMDARTIVALGDVDGDGLGDVLVTPDWDAPPELASAYLFRGRP